MVSTGFKFSFPSNALGEDDSKSLVISPGQQWKIPLDDFSCTKRMKREFSIANTATAG
jgi:hypothetical protein